MAIGDGDDTGATTTSNQASVIPEVFPNRRYEEEYDDDKVSRIRIEDENEQEEGTSTRNQVPMGLGCAVPGGLHLFVFSFN